MINMCTKIRGLEPGSARQAGKKEFVIGAVPAIGSDRIGSDRIGSDRIVARLPPSWRGGTFARAGAQTGRAPDKRVSSGVV
jgi:hypothetical protein